MTELPILQAKYNHLATQFKDLEQRLTESEREVSFKDQRSNNKIVLQKEQVVDFLLTHACLSPRVSIFENVNSINKQHLNK